MKYYLFNKKKDVSIKPLDPNHDLNVLKVSAKNKDISFRAKGRKIKETSSKTTTERIQAAITRFDYRYHYLAMRHIGRPIPRTIIGRPIPRTITVPALTYDWDYIYGGGRNPCLELPLDCGIRMFNREGNLEHGQKDFYCQGL